MGYILRLLLLFTLFESIYSGSRIIIHKKDIYLNGSNTIILNTEIDKDSVNKFMLDLYEKEDKDNLYLYLDTLGGSVIDGLIIIEEIKKFGISCIVRKAYSMGFVFLQYCKRRYITEHSIIMQHQMMYMVEGNHNNIQNIIKHYDNINEVLVRQQVKKLEIDINLFKNNIKNDWWLYGINIILNKCADEIVNVYYTNDIISCM